MFLRGMKGLVFLLFWPGIVLPGKPLHAQFDLGAEIRPRAEFREGYRRLPDESDKAAAFVYQRSRLTAGFAQSRVSVHLSVQDVRAWGQP